jgi:transcription elongation factor Elf1
MVRYDIKITTRNADNDVQPPPTEVPYREIRCPYCNHRLMDIREHGKERKWIRVKCDGCGRMINF